MSVAPPHVPPAVVVRFAPSPTGYLHLGNARTALINYLFARLHGGRFILRLDDTDRERSTEAFAQAIVEDLAWLGIEPDLIVRQSERQDRHDEAARRLQAAGALYACYETAEELDYRRKRLRARGLPPVYDRAALRLSEAGRAALEAGGRAPYMRFLLPNHDGDPFAPHATEIGWHDLVRGPQTVDLASLSDPVLVRAGGSYLYTLPSVVDDIDLGVTHVIRGEDHVTNTGVQIALFRALGGGVPAFGHHNLLILADGSQMSKRTGTLSLRGLRADGFEPMAVASLAVLVGTAAAVEALPSLEVLASRLDLAHISRAPAHFDPAEIGVLNARLVHGMDYETVRPRLIALGADLGPAFWAAVRANLTTVGAVTVWRDVVRGPVPRAPDLQEEAGFLAAARALLPPPPWDETSFRTWTKALQAETGRRGRALFHPLRLAVTGREDGPEMARLMPLIDPAEMSARLF
ncbi:glutamate--tRNA ligase [Pseudoxanthobacter sp.]|uniref:glutamate--tRNA ligase n=1 Tax=Pseudoxanthobacter sp. TaxID=1925742 RepID=UPI002FE2BEDD